MSWAEGPGRRRPTAVVTGAAGFIGSHLVEYLLQRGWRVRGLDDLSTGRQVHLAGVAAAPDFEFVESPAGDERVLSALVADATHVFHLAGRVGPTYVERYPEATVTETVGTTRSVLAVVAERRVPVFFASSSEVYGDTAVQPLREDADLRVAPPSQPRSAYALARGVSELLVNLHVREGRGPAVVGRLFNAVGPRQSPDYGYVLPRFLRSALADEPLVVHGTGEQTRCFTAVADSVRAVVALLERPLAYGRTVNIGSRDEVTINHLARTVVQLTGSRSTIRHVPYEEEHGAGARDIRRRVPDTEALRTLVELELCTPLETIITGMLPDAVAAGRTGRPPAVPATGR